MGNWTMQITGHGQHDNSSPKDADELLRQFTANLEAAGHQVDSAHFSAAAKELVNVGDIRQWGERDRSHLARNAHEHEHDTDGE